MFKWLDVDIGNKTIEELNKEMCIENWPKRNFRLFLDGYALSSSQNHQIPIECLQQKQKSLNEQNTIEISWQKKFQLNAKPKPTNHKFNPKH